MELVWATKLDCEAYSLSTEARCCITASANARKSQAVVMSGAPRRAWQSSAHRDGAMLVWFDTFGGRRVTWKVQVRARSARTPRYTNSIHCTVGMIQLFF